MFFLLALLQVYRHTSAVDQGRPRRRIEMMKSILFIGLLLAVEISSSAQKFAIPESIPDEIAYTALFFVVRPAPKPHWDHETRLSWLAKRGFQDMEAQVIINSAIRFDKARKQMELALTETNASFGKNSLTTAANQSRDRIQTQWVSEALSIRNTLQGSLTTSGVVKLFDLILDIKRNIKMKVQ